jgi:sugar lactone lactonase YvrE
MDTGRHARLCLCGEGGRILVSWVRPVKRLRLSNRVVQLDAMSRKMLISHAMFKPVRALACIAFVVGLMANTQAQEGRDSDVRIFAILPESVATDPNNPGEPLRVGHPEGLTADSAGNVYAATFETTVQNYIYVFDPLGALKVSLPVPVGRAPLGMVTDRQHLYVNDVLNGDLMRYDLPVTNASEPVVYDICGGFLAAFGIGAPQEAFCALNANDLGPDGRLYITDNGAGPSFVFSERFRNGRIFVLDPRTGASGVWFDGDTRRELDVAIAGFPEFGVNGIAFSNDGTELYLANMSTDVIYKMPVQNCSNGCQPTTLREFVRGNGINGPDNIAFDENGILWIASGQNDRVVAVNPRGVVVAKFGAFEGFTRGGAPLGLLQPSGIAVVGDRVYVGNEASRGLRPNPDLLPEEVWDQLRLYTISEIRTWAVLFQ